MLQLVKKEITQYAPAKKQRTQHTPLVKYDLSRNRISIQEGKAKLDPNQLLAIKYILADHLAKKKSIDLILEVKDVSEQNLRLLFTLFKYCQVLNFCEKEINIAWFIPKSSREINQIALDFRELYDLNMRIFSIN